MQRTERKRKEKKKKEKREKEKGNPSTNKQELPDAVSGGCVRVSAPHISFSPGFWEGRRERAGRKRCSSYRRAEVAAFAFQG